MTETLLPSPFFARFAGFCQLYFIDIKPTITRREKWTEQQSSCWRFAT
jgi:hypothetical protein